MVIKHTKTFGSQWLLIQEIIRKKIGFKGILISDDISMKSLKYGLKNNAIMKKRKLHIIVLSLFIGAIFGGVVGNIFSLVLPESVVKDFFLTSITFDLGGLVNNDLGVFVIDLKIIVLKLGLSISFNFTSVIGIAVAYYILRYLR